MIAALFVSRKGPYWNRPDVDAWDEARDARKYEGPHPVVCHPPCNLWVNLAAMNYARATRLNPDGTRKEPNRKIRIPAWYEGGDDGGCFHSALQHVMRYSGVLEHPAESHAWDVFQLPKPSGTGWSGPHSLMWIGERFWVCEVYQSAYGHKARKRTWLLYSGANPPAELNWEKTNGTHQIGWFDRKKPTCGKRAAIETPLAFYEALVGLARGAK